MGKAAFKSSLVQFVTFEGESRLQRVEEKCFAGCENLATVAIPEGAEVVGDLGQI
jgi:hypothetical protein